MKVFRIYVICTLLFITAYQLYAQNTSGGKKISPELMGLFFEDINYAADGGLYAELIQNRSFEYNPAERKNWHPFSFWEFVTPGFSIGNISVETKNPVHPNNPHYIVLDAEFVGDYAAFEGQAGVGLKNTGFDGIVIRADEQYNFSFFAHLESEEPVDFLLQLQNTKGNVIAESNLEVTANQWQNYSTTLTATASCDTASLLLMAITPGEVAMDMISLFPEKTFKKRPNGLRADLAQTLADLQPKFVRFPGGCLVHGDGLGNMYRWKNTVGPVEQRVEQRNIWGYHQTAGLGYFEYFQFCEDIGAKPIPIVPAGVSCQNSGGTHIIKGVGQKALCMNHMKDYVQEVLDLIEWANGPETTTWGAVRAAAGHPEPFGLEYVGIGNEDKITPEFEERFAMIYEAVKKKHPEITIIGTSGPFHSGDDYDKGWTIAHKLQIPIVDEHYYVGPEWFLANQKRYDEYDRSMGEVYLGEYATWGNKLFNAVAEAAYLTALERNGDIVRMASYAPMLAKKGFTQWSTDMIFFDNVNIVHTPNYHVQKMFMNNQGDYFFNDVVSMEEENNYLAASCVVDAENHDIIVKLVNALTEEKSMKVDLSKFINYKKEAQVTLLKGHAEDENTFDFPNKITPKSFLYKVARKFEYHAPAMSVTVIRIKSTE